MCAVIGLWNFEGVPIDRSVFEAARDTMNHRGPDDFGAWISSDSALMLGHRRLSIIDLSLHASQPFVNQGNGDVIVFNGEIYNFNEIKSELLALGHDFQTSSDTEVLLHSYQEWGVKCLDRLVGMFAFSIFERDKNRLFIARDRFGVKPLYYSFDDHGFGFSSTMESLIQLKGGSVKPNNLAIRQHLELGWGVGAHTLISGISKLPPGNFAIVAPGEFNLYSYWSPENITIDHSFSKLSEDELDDHFDVLVTQSVKSRMVSDVPIGVFLSGGIDSSLVTSILSEECSAPVNTFTIGFEDRELDESLYARDIAEYLGCTHNEIFITPSMLLEEVEKVLSLADEPFSDVASLPTSILSRYASNEVKVCLTGDGGDELFLGYPLHSVLDTFSWLNNIPYSIRRSIAAALNVVPSRKINLFSGLCRSKDFASQYLYLRSLSRSPIMEDWAASAYVRRSLDSSLPFSKLAALLDIQYYLPQALLPKTDLSTMLWSLEGREPLLDHRLAESALSLPPELTAEKRVLKSLLGRRIPKEMWDRPKHAFDVPIDEWLRTSLSSKLDELREEWKFEEVFSSGLVAQLIDDHQSGARNNGSMLWSMITLHSWFKKCRVS